MPEQNLKLAREYLEQGQSDEALKVIRIELDAHPEDPALHEILGDIAREQGDGAEAGWRYERAKNGYLEKSQPAGAIVVTEKLAKLKPQDMGLRWRLAELYAQFGLRREAHQRFLAYAETMAGDKNGERLLTAAGRLLELDPKNLDLRFGLARLMVAFGNIDTAVEELKRIVFEFRDHGDLVRAGEIENYLNRLGESS